MTMSRGASLTVVLSTDGVEVKRVSLEHHLFGDELVSAKDLNRQPGRILDMALNRPVTITRNDDAFALLRREQVFRWIAAADTSQLLVDLMEVIILVGAGTALPNGHRFAWVSVFDAEEQRELIGECLAAFHSAQAGKAPWSDLEAVIHEWEESAVAMTSRELEEAVQEEPDEVPLTIPSGEEVTES